MVVTEGHNVEVLVSRSAVEDSHVLVVTIQLEQGQAHVGSLLVAELVTGDVDLTVGAGLTGQSTTKGLRTNDVLASALGVHSVDHFVKLAQVESSSGSSVLEVLAGAVGDTSGQAVELGGGLVGVAVNKQSFPSHTHCADAALDLVGLGFSALEGHDSAVNLDVATEELEALGLLADFSVGLGQASVVVPEPDVGKRFLALPKEPVAFDVAEREDRHELASGQFGHNSKLLWGASVLLCFQ